MLHCRTLASGKSDKESPYVTMAASIREHLDLTGDDLKKVERFPTYLLVLREERNVDYYQHLLNDEVFSSLRASGDLFLVGDQQVTLASFAARFRCVDGDFAANGVYKWCEAQVDMAGTPWQERKSDTGSYQLGEAWYDKTVDSERDAVHQLLRSFGAKSVKLLRMKYKVDKGVRGKARKAGKWTDSKDGMQDTRIERVQKIFRLRKVIGSNKSIAPELNGLNGSCYFPSQRSVQGEFEADASSVEFFEKRWDEAAFRKITSRELRYTVRNRCRNDASILARRFEVLFYGGDLTQDDKDEYEYETVEKTLKVSFHPLKLEPIRDADWERSRQETAAYSQTVRRLKEELQAFLREKRPYENAFNGIRKLLVGPVGSGKTTIVYSLLRALSGGLSLKSQYVRDGPPGLHTRTSAMNFQANDGTRFGAGATVFVNFYPLLEVDYRVNESTYEGYLAMFDTQGLKVPENEEDIDASQAQAKKTYKKTMGQRRLTVKQRDGEVHVDSKLRYLYSSVYNIVPDLQVFVIDGHEFIVDNDRFERACALVKLCHETWEMTRYLPDGFVVVLTKKDLFYENGGTENDRENMLDRVGEIFEIPQNQLQDRTFFIENHRKPNSVEIVNSFQDPTTYRRKYIQRSRDALALLQGLLRYARHYRDDEAALTRGAEVVLQMQKVVSIGIDYFHRDYYSYDCFLSYHQRDSERFFGTTRIRVIQNCIHSLGLRVYTDFGNRRDAASIQHIMQNVKKSRVFVVVWTKHYFASKFCVAELLSLYTDRGNRPGSNPNGPYWPRSALPVPVPCPCWQSDHSPRARS